MRHELNVDSGTKEDAQDLADADTWDTAAWDDVITTARNECEVMLTHGPLARFWTSKHFVKFHKSQAGSAPDAAEAQPANPNAGGL